MEKLSIISPVQEKHLTKSREFQGIPGIERTPGGRLWGTWYSGGTGEGPDNFVVLVTSDDDGITWSEPVAVVDAPGNERCFDPALWIAPDGVMRWFWAHTWSPADGTITNGCDGVWYSECSDCESASPEWSEPVRFANGVMMNKPTAMSNGEWAYPTALWSGNIGNATASGELVKECFSNMSVSFDGGRSFELRIGPDVIDRGYDEHMFVELNNKKIWCLVRTRCGIGQSFSDDFGRTWHDTGDAGLGGPNSRFFIRRLASGRLLLVNHAYNDQANKYTRSNMTAYLSEDDGKSWPYSMMLDEREMVSYPDGKQDEDGNIWIIYDFNRYGAGDILFAKFTEEDVMSGKIVTEGSKLRQLINRTGGVKEKK